MILANPTPVIDSHCHLDRLSPEVTGGDLSAFIHSSHRQNIQHMLCVCINLQDFSQVLRLAQDFDFISATVGVHPGEPAAFILDPQALLDRAQDSKIVAIGETGLDYHYHQEPLDWQRERFRTHIEVARHLKKPLIVHSRAAKTDTLRILKESHAQDVGGVMHCFTEDWDMAKQALDLNFYISFSGIVTFKSAAELQEVARKVPLDRLMVETDAPYLAPVPMRGKSNQPLYVKYVVDKIATLRQISYESLADHANTNFYRLMAIKTG